MVVVTVVIVPLFEDEGKVLGDMALVICVDFGSGGMASEDMTEVGGDARRKM